MLIFANPPEHPRIRSVLSRAFTPRVVERLRPRISQLVDGHLDRCAQLGTFDLVAELAGVLPSQVICEMLGVPLDDQPEVERWTADIAATVTPVLTDEILAAADKTTLEFHAYLRGLCRDRRARPRDDLLTAMVQAEDEEGRLTDEELVSFAVTLLGAGTETTTNLIGVGTLALLQTPAELARGSSGSTVRPANGPTWPSGKGSTTAWAPPWPGPKARSPCGRCSSTTSRA
jgi:cytochrome P450